MANTNISLGDNILDSRAVIAKLEEMREERQDLLDAIKEAPRGKKKAAKEELQEWNDDNAEELKAWEELAQGGADYAGDWEHGATLILDSHFEDYAKQYAEDIGAINGDEKWPATHIDWSAAAEELKADYTEIEADGNTYLVRNS